eukprot:494136-Prorocentrum_minimum.AAC.1
MPNSFSLGSNLSCKLVRTLRAPFAARGAPPFVGWLSLEACTLNHSGRVSLTPLGPAKRGEDRFVAFFKSKAAAAVICAEREEVFF